jgi:hypothetical protein
VLIHVLFQMAADRGERDKGAGRVKIADDLVKNFRG